jgi:hypothetical protein
MNQEPTATVYRISTPASRRDSRIPSLVEPLGSVIGASSALALFHLYRLAMGAVGIIAPRADVSPTHVAVWRFANRKARMAQSHNRTRPFGVVGDMMIKSQRIKLDSRLTQRWQELGWVCTGRTIAMGFGSDLGHCDGTSFR